jgi:hypothetical protein
MRVPGTVASARLKATLSSVAEDGVLDPGWLARSFNRLVGNMTMGAVYGPRSEPKRIEQAFAQFAANTSDKDALEEAHVGVVALLDTLVTRGRFSSGVVPRLKEKLKNLVDDRIGELTAQEKAKTVIDAHFDDFTGPFGA